MRTSARARAHTQLHAMINVVNSREDESGRELSPFNMHVDAHLYLYMSQHPSSMGALFWLICSPPPPPYQPPLPSLHPNKDGGDRHGLI